MGNRYSGIPKKEINEILDVIPLSVNTIRLYAKKGVNFKELCIVLESDKIPETKKKKYVYSLSCISDDARDKIWELYVGDVDEDLISGHYLNLI